MRSTKNMAKFKVVWTQRGITYDSPVYDSFPSIDKILALAGRAKTITVLRDPEGEGHPNNAGKFFLDRIIK
jgi:hypothetical protein